MRVFGRTVAAVDSGGVRVLQAERPPGCITPGTPMLKAIPPRLVEPYLTGQRAVIAGYIYRAQDCPLHTPAEFCQALGLGYPGSDFRADMPELSLLRWQALDMTGSLLTPLPDGGYGHGAGPAAGVPEFFTLPAPIPVGAEIHRVTRTGAELLACYDGQSWERPAGRP